MALERRTPLARGRTPMARTGLKRTPPVPRPRPPSDLDPPAKPRPSTRARSGPTQAERDAAKTRDGGRCIACGAPATDLDHIIGRGMGGVSGPVRDRMNSAAYLRTLCGWGNASGHHAWKERGGPDVFELGYRLRRNGIQVDPATVPVWTWRGWAFFLDDGTRRDVDMPAPSVTIPGVAR